MGFKLKDKQLQRKLDDLSDGDFSRVLSSRTDRVRSNSIVRVRFGERIGEDSAPKAFIAFFYGCELKRIKDKNLSK